MKLDNWLPKVSGPDWYWYVKVLAGNDTLLTKSHQAGPYIPLSAAGLLFPTVMQRQHDKNPRWWFTAHIDSHEEDADVALIWYNNKIVEGKSRNEVRITGWGGRASPLLDPDSTGSLCVFAFHKTDLHDADLCRVWLCRDESEEDTITGLVGPVDPGIPLLMSNAGINVAVDPDLPCTLTIEDVPPAWLVNFPDAQSIVDMAVENIKSATRKPVDKRLLLRRDCEFEMFKSLENIIVLPRVNNGFKSIALFVDLANSVTNRRKSRSGLSLEYHLRKVFDEEGLPYSHNKRTEKRNRPDFVFPSIDAYRDPDFPAQRLRMLAVKTTLKERWPQILKEAERISEKHLLTLQRGVTEHQFAEMQRQNVRLVVPRAIHRTFPREVRGDLIPLNEFIKDTARTCGN